ncbi:MAG: Do family serine endopeptidase [Chitinivibrionales bacterium]|nr:Do family serine endopeptidase [Chitinivibrionales bacterium]
MVPSTSAPPAGADDARCRVAPWISAMPVAACCTRHATFHRLHYKKRRPQGDAMTRTRTVTALGLALVTLSLLLVPSTHTGCTRAEADRPREGSIEFGARRKPTLPDQPQALQSFKTVFADVAERVVPSVVSVIPTKIDTVVFYKNPFYFFNNPNAPDRNQGNSPFDFFFGPRGDGGGGQGPDVRKQERRQRGLGSGVIVSEDGYVLTNYHVISGADEVDVKLHDGREVEAEIVGSDSLSDVAVLKIASDIEGLDVAYLGDSDSLRPGSWVIAVGNPFSLTSSVTVGIVSALGRSVLGPVSYQNFIQTDAAINPGNSGGALANIDGEIIGINTMIYSRSGGYMGIGFAIPVNMATRIMKDIIYRGEVVRGWIGVSIQSIDAATRDALDLGTRQGVLIADVYEGQPADEGGMRRGDVVLSVDGNPVGSANELRNTVAALRPGEKVPVRILRDGKEKTLRIRIAKRSEERIQQLASAGGAAGEDSETEAAVEETIGLEVASITGEYRAQYSIPRSTKGIVVLGATKAFTDARRQIKGGDVISEVRVDGAHHAIENMDDFRKALGGVKEGSSVMLLVQRGGRSFYVAFAVK